MALGQESVAALRTDLMLSLARDMLGDELPRNKAAFLELLEQARPRWVPEAMERETICLQLAQEVQKVRGLMQNLPAGFAPAVSDISQQLQRLLAPGFLYRTPVSWLRQYRSYICAMARRIEKMQGQLERDLQQIPLFEEFWSAYQRFDDLVPDYLQSNFPKLQELRWMIEELRISLFAQPMKTSRPVSPKRLQTLIDNLEKDTKTLRAD